MECTECNRVVWKCDERASQPIDRQRVANQSTRTQDANDDEPTNERNTNTQKERRRRSMHTVTNSNHRLIGCLCEKIDRIVDAIIKVEF
jgi:hypothetical protein